MTSSHEGAAVPDEDSSRLRASARRLCDAILEYCEQALSVPPPADLNVLDGFEDSLLRVFHEHSLVQEDVIGTSSPFDVLGDLYVPDDPDGGPFEDYDESSTGDDDDHVEAVTLLLRSDFNVADEQGLIELARDVDTGGCYDADVIHLGMALQILEREHGSWYLRQLTQLVPCGTTVRVLSTPRHSGEQEWQLDDDPFQVDGTPLFQADEIDPAE